MRNKSGVLLQRSWIEALDLIFWYPKIMVSFVVLALIEAAFIMVGFILIQPPGVFYIEPIVLRYYGEYSLAYPYCLILVARMFYHAQFVLALLFGIPAIGITTHAAGQARSEKTLSLRQACKATTVAYPGLLLVHSLIMTLLILMDKFGNRFMVSVFAQGGFLTLTDSMWLTIIAAVGVLTTAFIYACFGFSAPLLVLKGASLFTVWWRSARLFFQNGLVIIPLVVVPMGLHLPIILMKTRIGDMAQSDTPEMVIVVLLLGVLVSFLVNTVITVALTCCYLEITAPKK